MTPLRVFITGASSGIGAALAASMRRRAPRWACWPARRIARRPDRQPAPTPEHRAYAVDVRDHAAINRAAQAFLAHAGGIDVVIANAGISVGTLTEYAEDIPVFADIIATNVVATAATFAPFIAAMRAQRTPGGWWASAAWPASAACPAPKRTAPPRRPSSATANRCGWNEAARHPRRHHLPRLHRYADDAD
jgi:NAD(P)-dependent dehydrogenase (short-subunit alcohol dehydrogenase family)